MIKAHSKPIPRTPVPTLSRSQRTFSEVELATYLVGQGHRVREFRGRKWRTGSSPSPIAGRHWSPLIPERLSAAEAGFPEPGALSYRCLSLEAGPSTFPYVVFRDMAGYGAQRLTKGRCRQVRHALNRYQYLLLRDPEILLDQGWVVANAADRGSPVHFGLSQRDYLRTTAACFDDEPPVVWAAMDGSRLAGYAVTYACRSEAVFEKLYVRPPDMVAGAGLGLYWQVLTGWGQTPGVQNVWTGGSLPHRGVDSFKIRLGASLEHLSVHAGMRAPLLLAARWFKPKAVSLAALHA